MSSEVGHSYNQEIVRMPNISRRAQDVVNDIEGRYCKKTPTSKALYEEACKHLPGGDTRNTSYFKPYTIFMEKGKGSHLWDYDGNDYIDVLNNYTSTIHGHAHPRITDAIRKQAREGTALCGPSDKVSKLAKMIVERIPAMDLLRFNNSGTEADMFAVRAARAYTGKDGVIKMHGGYNGSIDVAEVSVFSEKPEPVLEGKGIPVSVLNDVYVAPYNDLDVVEAILKEYKDKIACVITEPMMGLGGFIPPHNGYLQGLRDLADRYAVVLIFDEVITFRFSTGGMQKMYNVDPDITVLGKVIGGGLPIGAFGGKKEIMSMFDPSGENPVFHSGTFCGNHLTMAAGLASMELLDETAINRINTLGDRMREGFNSAFKKVGIAGQATGVGSALQIHWSGDEMKNGEDTLRAARAAGDLPRLMNIEMINRGIFFGPRGIVDLSTPTTAEEIDQVNDAFLETLDGLKPYVAEVHPDLTRY